MARTRRIPNALELVAGLFLLSAALAAPDSATNLTVGPGKAYSTVVAAYMAAQAGDSISIYPATYINDHVAINKQNLYIRGTGGSYPKFDAQQDSNKIE